MDLGGYSQTGPREANEDSFCVHDFPQGAVFTNGITAFIMVSDGMGGYQGGDVASTLAVQSAEGYLSQIIEMASSNQVALDMDTALREMVENAHEAVLDESSARGNVSMGATFVGAFVSPTHAWIGHVGDSRAYCIRGNRVMQLTEDHSQVGRMLSRGIITEEEAQSHPSRNRIERALGFPNAKVEVDEVELQTGDVLLLCSDGVYTVMGKEALATQLAEAADAQDAAQRIVEAAIKKHTDDNATVTVAFIGQADPFAPSADSATAALPDQSVAPAVAVKRSSTIAMNPEESAQLRARLDEPPAASGQRAYTHGGESAGTRARRRARARAAAEAQRRQEAKRRRMLIAAIAVVALVVIAAVIFFGSQAFLPQVSEDVGSSQDAPQTVSSDSRLGSESKPAKELVNRDVIQSGDIKFIDAKGEVHNFSSNTTDIKIDKDLCPNVAAGVSVTTKGKPKGYGQENKTYYKLGSKYKKALFEDLDAYDGSNMEFSSDLSEIVGDQESYRSFIDALSKIDRNDLAAIKSLALEEECFEETSAEVTAGDNG